MVARITTLINKRDSSEIVGETIASILKLEETNQQALAAAERVIAEAEPIPDPELIAALDPRLWALRVFLERANPWAEFEECPDQLDATPIVNVSFDSGDFPKGGGNVVDRQQSEGTFHIDCYGYGVSEGDDTGHQPGDERAALEAQRAARLVRNILMSAHYTYLGFAPPRLVGRRWVDSIQMFQPQLETRPVSHVMAARLTFSVSYVETSPQVAGEALESISANILRADNGEVFLTAQFDFT